jgi:phosphatidylserine decarboxylase
MKPKWYVTGFIAAVLAALILSLAPSAQALAKAPEQAPESTAQAPLLPVVQEFKDVIENNPELLMLFTQMFQEVPPKPDSQGQVKNYHQMLSEISRILTQAPDFDTTPLVGTPINAVLNDVMATPSGAMAFLNPKVNRQLKKILNHWGVFLKSPDSCYVLSKDDKTGWFGRDAMAAMPGFVDNFVCDPKLPHYGFTCWDDFFTRRFRKGVRPVESPNDDNIIANACESAPFALARNVKLRDKFWIKGQPYSLYHMLDGDPLVEQFVGGTIYQAFLSALSYHRWHSPVSGTIVKTKLLDGSYYAEALSEGFDPAGPDKSQGYIAQLAARALVYIKADNPAIGLMCVIFIGMSEVSSNEITVYENQHVKKGEQLGMFHFGGSTHTLIFRPGVNLKFDLRGQKPGVNTKNIPVRAKIAQVLRPKSK